MGVSFKWEPVLCLASPFVRPHGCVRTPEKLCRVGTPRSSRLFSELTREVASVLCRIPSHSLTSNLATNIRVDQVGDMQSAFDKLAHDSSERNALFGRQLAMAHSSVSEMKVSKHNTIVQLVPARCRLHALVAAACLDNAHMVSVGMSTSSWYFHHCSG